MADEDPRPAEAAQILGSVSDGIIALDGDLTCRYINARARHLLETDAESLVGRHIWDIVPEGTGTVAQESIERALAAGCQESFERYNARTERWFEVRVYPRNGGVTIVFADTTDARAAQRKLDRIVTTTPVGIAILDAGGAITRANARAEELLGLEESEIAGRAYTHPEWKIWDEAGDPIPAADHPVSHVLDTAATVQGFTHGITLPDGAERWLSSNVTPVVGEDDSIEQVVVALEDITELKDLEQLIETFQPVNELLSEATSRREAEIEICNLLTDTRAYDIAWIGEHTGGTTLRDASRQSGVASTLLEETALPLTDVGPAREAITTKTVAVVDDVAADPRFRPFHEAILSHDLRAMAAVPIARADHVYGVLELYTKRPSAFDRRERTLLRTLGKQIGTIVHAIETEQQVHTSAAVELTFTSTDTRSFLVAASDELDCALDVQDTIQTAEEGLVRYVAVEGASVAAVEALAATREQVVDTRPVREPDGETPGVVEVVSTGASLAQTLVTRGAVVTTDSVAGGEATVVCEIPASRDVGSLVAALTESFPATELTAKRTLDRAQDGSEPTAETVLTDAFEADLSDRQRQVLRAAIHGGYFESPRRSSASEIADALSLTQSTVSYHLREAQRTLFEQVQDRL